MGIFSYPCLLLVLILGIIEVNLAVKPKGKKSKGPENTGEAGSVQVQINWRRNYDEDFIRLLYKVVHEDGSPLNNTGTGTHGYSTGTNSTGNNTEVEHNNTFLCTHCSLVTNDQECHEKYEVCPTAHGCFRHVFIKYGQRFLDKGCWHEPIGSTYGRCACKDDTEDDYSCFCETCSLPMCNSEIITGGKATPQNTATIRGFRDTLVVVMLINLWLSW